MTIYVIRPGDTLWDISRRFGVSVDRITTANGLQEIPYLVVGQALVIPSTESAYRVQPGDSLWSIARKYRVTVERIAALNGITDPSRIMSGMILRIPQLSKQYGYIETNAYIEPSTAEVETRLTNEVGRYLTYISPFSYQVNEDGSINQINDAAILRAARGHRTAP